MADEQEAKRGWQPIDTLTPILDGHYVLWSGVRLFVGWQDDDGWHDASNQDRDDEPEKPQPTHWHPWPVPPERPEKVCARRVMADDLPPAITLEQFSRALAIHAMLTAYQHALHGPLAPEWAEDMARMIQRFASGQPLERPDPGPDIPGDA